MTPEDLVSSRWATILNRPLSKVEVTPDKDYVVFHFEAGDPVRYSAVGECCSTSWIEHVELPCEDVRGLAIVDVHDNDGVPVDHAVWKKGDPSFDDRKIYLVRFITAKGEIVLEFRNDSNGYYGGWLEGPCK